jgi:tellurite resistance protein
MIFADGSIEEDEKALVSNLQQQLGVPDALASQILDVMVIKHRG